MIKFIDTSNIYILGTSCGYELLGTSCRGHEMLLYQLGRVGVFRQPTSIWILFGYNFNFAVILKFGEIPITRKIAQISKSIKAYKMHGIEIFESPNGIHHN